MANMNLDQLQILFYVLLGLILVTLGTLVAYVVVANRRERAKLAQTYEEAMQAPRAPIEVTGRILSLVRDQPGQPIQVEIGGVKFRALAEIEDAQLRRQVVSAALEMIHFTGALGEVPALPPLEKTGRWREDLRHGSQAEVDRIRASSADQEAPPAPAEVEARFLNLLAEMGQPTPTAEKPSVAAAVRQRFAKAPDAEQRRSFVHDIEAIVQRRVGLIPALSGRSLHVRTGATGAVRFGFEGQEYETLDKIPNLTAQQVIREAIQEWEETT